MTLLRSVASFVRELRRRDFDLVLDFHAILKSGLLSYLSGAPTRVSYERPFARELAWIFANRRADLGSRRISRFERNAALVAYLGGEPEKIGAALLQPGPAAAARMQEALGGACDSVLIHPGTSRGAAYKRYPPSGHAAVARALAESPGVSCLVSRGQGREERRLAEAIVAQSEGAARLAPETHGFDDLIALLSHAQLFIGSDSGPLHAASLLGVPVVQLMGPTDPVENSPWAGTPWRRVRFPVPCSPCRRGCAAQSCMQLIRPESVAAEARTLLLERARRRHSPAEDDRSMEGRPPPAAAGREPTVASRFAFYLP